MASKSWSIRSCPESQRGLQRQASVNLTFAPRPLQLRYHSVIPSDNPQRAVCTLQPASENNKDKITRYISLIGKVIYASYIIRMDITYAASI